MASGVPLVLWAVAPPEQARGGHALLDATGQLSGLVGMAMLSIAFVLSSRVRSLESWFGGLDGMYRVHHALGLSAFSLLLLHPIGHAARFIPEEMERFFLFFAPSHGQAAVNFGVIAFWLMAALIGLTLYSRVPYDKWKLSHKVMGVVLVLGAVHLIGVEPTRGRAVSVAGNPFLRSYILLLTAAGLFGYVYKLLVVPLLARRHPYRVAQVRRLNPRVLEVSLVPQDGHVRFEPGQFVFVTFYADALTREAHPFTICSIPREGHVTFTVKSLGDFTERLHARLEPCTGAKLEGPYGRFDYREGSSRQIWLAGGVGIAPFLSWARHMVSDDGEPRDVELYYCVHSREDAVFLDDFRTIEARLEGFRVALICSAERGRLRADEVGDLEGRDIFMCGPKRFTSDLQRQFVRRGVPRQRIHFEDFEFR